MEHDELQKFINKELDMGYYITPHWHRRANYIVGDLVRFNGEVYRCKQPHISIEDWNPTVAQALWEKTQRKD